jgi:hypothetical protein
LPYHKAVRIIWKALVLFTLGYINHDQFRGLVGDALDRIDDELGLIPVEKTPTP